MSKKLEYSTHEPAFLQRMKAGFSGSDGRSNVKQIRPGRSRLKTSDENGEDEPVVLDESGEVVGWDEWQGMQKGEAEEKKAVEASKVEVRGEEERERETKMREQQKMAGIGGVKKRKVVKVVGGDGKEDEVSEDGDVRVSESESQGAKRKETDETGREDVAADSKIVSDKKKEISKPKKKAKKIKLSFDDPE